MPVILLGKAVSEDSLEEIKKAICQGLLDDARQVNQAFQQIPADCFSTAKPRPVACQDELPSIDQLVRLINKWADKCVTEGDLSTEQAQDALKPLPDQLSPQKLPKFARHYTKRPMAIQKNDVSNLQAENHIEFWLNLVQ